MTKRLDEDSIHPLETAYDKAIKRMEERETRILNSPTMQMAASVAEQIRVQQAPLIQALQPLQDAMQPYHNLMEQNSLGLTAATASLSSVAQTLVPDDAMSSMTGRSCYYIAEDKEGALKEIYKHSGGTKPRVQVIGLKAVKSVKLLDLSGEVKKTNRFIEHMRFTVENEVGKTVHEYLLPNYVASCCKEIGIDGIRYRSTGYNCCVLWRDDYFEYAEGSREVIPE